ncbi:MAG TPA: hypothetical protein VGD99_26715 [Anaerolineae bacterium]|jgi:hypothetical protein
MSRRLRQLIENQLQVKVASQAQTDALEKTRFTMLALFCAGVFYFYGYYFLGEVLWRVLSGG